MSMTGLQFFVVCDPPKTNHQRKQIVTKGEFSTLADRPELVAAKRTLDALLLPHQPETPVAGPVSLTVSYVWPWLKKHKARDRAAGKVRHTSKPDLSNAIKTLEDRLVALRFIEDDRSVAVLYVEKWWGERSGIAVRILSLAATAQPLLTSAPSLADTR